MAQERKGRSPRSPEESVDEAIRIFPRGPHAWLAADFRRWGKGRITLRDPDAVGWPAAGAGERTVDREVGRRWTERYIDLFREEVRRRQLKLGTAPRRLGDACTAYIEHRRDVERRPINTWQNDQAALNHLRYQAAENAETGRKGDDLRTDRLDEPFLGRLFSALLKDGYAVNSVHGTRRGISGFLRWMGHGEQNAARACILPNPKDDEHAAAEPQTWEADQVVLLRASADECDRTFKDFQHHRRALELALHCGARRNELFALTGRHLRADDDTIRITHQVHKSERRLVVLKGKMARTALLLPDWRDYIPVLGSSDLLLPAPGGGLVQPDVFVDLGQRILRGAELHVPGVGWHSFRHTYARDFLWLGGWLEELQRSLGHQSLSTTERTYYHFKSDDAALRARQRIYRTEPIRLVG